MTVWAVLTVLAVLESTLPSFRLSYKIQQNEAAVAVLTVRVARPQNEVATKSFFRGTKFLTKNALKFSSNVLSLHFVGQKKIPQNSRQTSRQISLQRETLT